MPDPSAKAYLVPAVRSIVSGARQLVTAALALNASRLDGDFVETGVFTGGTSVIMARVLRDRAPQHLLYACDSFQGLPGAGEKDRTRARACRGCHVGRRGEFRAGRVAFEAYLLTEGLERHVRVVEGFFADTLPPAGLERISFLRLDGDLYDSTATALRRLYPLVVPGGFVFVDDYGSFRGCRAAVDEFFAHEGLSFGHLRMVSERGGRQQEAAWFQKPK